MFDSQLMTRHSGGVLSINEGPVLEIKAKLQKQSLQFRVATSDGLSSRLDGILGINMSSSMFTVQENEGNIVMTSNQQHIEGKIDKLTVIVKL